MIPERAFRPCNLVLTKFRPSLVWISLDDYAEPACDVTTSVLVDGGADHRPGTASSDGAADLYCHSSRFRRSAGLQYCAAAESMAPARYRTTTTASLSTETKPALLSDHAYARSCNVTCAAAAHPLNRKLPLLRPADVPSRLRRFSVFLAMAKGRQHCSLLPIMVMPVPKKPSFFQRSYFIIVAGDPIIFIAPSIICGENAVVFLRQ